MPITLKFLQLYSVHLMGYFGEDIGSDSASDFPPAG